MQTFNPLDEIGGKRRSGLEHHPASRLRRRASTAIEEPEPGHSVDKHPVPVDEIRDPENPVAQENGDFASLAQPQKLTLNGTRSALVRSHGQRTP